MLAVILINVETKPENFVWCWFGFICVLIALLYFFLLLVYPICSFSTLILLVGSSDL